MRSRPASGRARPHVVTEARQARSAEIAQRERRYLLLMGIRAVCFVVSVVLFLNHVGWLAMIPAVAAIVLPYFAVVVANARRAGESTGFRPYEPRLPDRYVPSKDAPESSRPPAAGR